MDLVSEPFQLQKVKGSMAPSTRPSPGLRQALCYLRVAEISLLKDTEG